MKILINYTKEDYFLKLLYLLKNISPFNKLTGRELELYSYFLYYNDKYKNIPLRDRNKLIFNCDVRREIAEKMKIGPARVYNITTLLKKKKIVDNKKLNPQYIFNKTDYLAFIFKEKNE